MADTPDIELLLAQRDWIQALARRLVGDPHQAADLAQESMLRALAHPPPVAGDTNRLRGWLVRVAQDLAYKARRTDARRSARERRVARAALGEEAQRGNDESVELIARADLHQQLVAAVLQLPEPSRSAVLWRYFEGHSVAMIAKREGLEPAAVRKRITRGIARLRAALDERHGGDRAAWCQLLLPLAAGRATRGATLGAMVTWAAAAVLVAGLSLAAVRALGPREDLAAGPDAELATSSRLAVTPGNVTPVVQLVGEIPQAAPDAREPVVSSLPSQDPDGEPRLTVRVVSEDQGEPVAGVRVILVPASGGAIFGQIVDRSTGGPHESLRTGAEGVVEISVPPDVEWTLRVQGRAVEYGDLTLGVAKLTEGERRELPIRLAPGERRPYHVQLLDAETGQGIEGAEFRGPSDRPKSRVVNADPGDLWVGAHTWEPDGELLGRSDGAGHVELTWLSWNPGTARIFAREYGAASLSLTGTRADPRSPKVIRLSRAARVFGHVSDAAGDGVAGLSVGLMAVRTLDHTDESHRGVGTYAWKTQTAADGSFELAGLPALSNLGLEIRDGQKRLYSSPEPLRLQPGEARELSHALAATHDVRGRLLTEDGQPVGSALVQLAPAPASSRNAYLSSYGKGKRETRTDAEGHFVFEDVATGGWTVGPAPRRAGKIAPWAPYGLRIEVPGDTPTVIAHSHFIEGTVRTDTGAPLYQAEVSASRIGDGMSTSVSTDSDGHFRVGPLAPGEHQLLVMPVGQGSPTGWIDTEGTTALAGATGVELTLVRSGAIVGRPVDASTGLVVDAKVYVDCLTSRSRYALSTSEYRGGFSFGNLEPGRYVVVARTEDAHIGVLRDLEVEADVTREGIEVEVSPGARLELVAGSERRRCSVWWDGVRVTEVGLAPGTIQRVVVPAGVVRLVPFSPDGENPTEELEVTLEVGGTARLTLD